MQKLVLSLAGLALLASSPALADSNVGGNLSGPNGPAFAVLRIYDYSRPEVQQFYNCLNTDLNGRPYDPAICPLAKLPNNVVSSNPSLGGHYNLREQGQHLLAPGRYVMFVLAADGAEIQDTSGLEQGSWHVELLNINSDTEFNVQIGN